MPGVLLCLYVVLMPKNVSTQYGMMAYFTSLSKFCLSLTGYQLYGSLQATVRWDGGISAYFRVTQGTKQGSILSPVLFNPHETARYGEIASAILNFFVCCMEMG